MDHLSNRPRRIHMNPAAKALWIKLLLSCRYPQRRDVLHNSYVWKQFKQALKRAGLPTKGVRFHDLRHTCASLLISQGVHLSVVKERMRHSQISVTADTYGHVF